MVGRERRRPWPARAWACVAGATILAIVALAASAAAQPVPEPGPTAPPPAALEPAPAVDAAPPIDAAPPPVDAAPPPVDAAPRRIDAAMPPIDAAPRRIDAAMPPIDAALPPIDAALPPIDTAATDAAPPTAAPLPPPDPPEPATASPPPHEGKRTIVVIKLVLGFTALLLLAYIGGNRRVIALEQRLGVSGLITAGFPFIALGVVVRQPEVGLLTQDVLDRVQPILHFGLGWLGFIIGAQLDIRLLDRVPRGTAYLIIVEALVPFAATAAACGTLAAVLGIADPRAPEFWRDLILLGAAAAMTAPRRFRGFANRSWREGRSIDLLTSQLDEIVGVIGLLFVAAYFRPANAGDWAIPGTAWVFVTIGLGVVVGVLIFAMVRVPVSSGEFLAVVLGSVAFGSGLAGYLYLSPIVVCFIAGALVNNFPCEQRNDIFRILNHLERPIHLLFLVVAGASWHLSEPLPWVLVPAFVVARIVGKWAGVAGARKTVGFFMPAGFTDDRVLVSALSPLSIALVLSLYGSAGGTASHWIITLVIGGAILTEVAVQLTSPPTPRGAKPPAGGEPTEIDDLDGPTGPTYVDDDAEPLVPRARTKGDPP